MSILITGAGGFLGLNLIEVLNALGEPVVALNDRALPAAFAAKPGVTVELADVRDRVTVADILSRHDITCIIHAAAITLG
ncbi:MAG: NAD-dependent epimerase/dehydratase family protein, partial [Rhizobiaceae bacterium]